MSWNNGSCWHLLLSWPESCARSPHSDQWHHCGQYQNQHLPGNHNSYNHRCRDLAACSVLCQLFETSSINHCIERVMISRLTLLVCCFTIFAAAQRTFHGIDDRPGIRSGNNHVSVFKKYSFSKFYDSKHLSSISFVKTFKRFYCWWLWFEYSWWWKLRYFLFCRWKW